MKKMSLIYGILISLTTLALGMTTSAKAASHDVDFTVSNDNGSALAAISYNVLDLSDHGDSQVTYGTVYLYQYGENGRNTLISKTDYEVVPRQLSFNNLAQGNYYVWVNVGGLNDGTVNIQVTVTK